MKSLRLLLALAFASTLAAAAVRAEEPKKEEPAKCHGMACCKKKDKDGKMSCATESQPCCCDTGEKAEDGKAKEEKPAPKK
jgi:hypothetical protein